MTGRPTVNHESQVLPHKTLRRHPVAQWLLRAAACIFGSIVLLRRWLYDRGWLVQARPGVVCISVGALEAGGTGKTPVTDLILRHLLGQGRRPGLLTRGYRRPSRGLVTRVPGEAIDPAAVGDEAAMLVEAGVDVAVAACASRRRAAAALTRLTSVDTLVLDDGFSHRALARDLDIVVLRGHAPWGDGAWLPLGRLREPPSSLRRADVVWLHHKNAADAHDLPTPSASKGAASGTAGATFTMPAWAQQLCPQAVMVVSCAIATAPVDFQGRPVPLLQGRRLLAVAGIAAPSDLRRSLEAQHGCVVGDVSFPDHHCYDEHDIAQILTLADRLGAELVVTTPKDAVKLRRLTQDARWCVVGTRVQIVWGEAALNRVLRACAFPAGRGEVQPLPAVGRIRNVAGYRADTLRELRRTLVRK